jgi:plasmid stability protein
MYNRGMSKMIQIRDVPDSVHRALRMRAADAGLSLSEYLRRELERLSKERSVAEVLDDWKARRADIATGDIVDAIHDGRR